ncbi:hypothetical protein GYMLUDRAFT_250126 [Collybiopsis luxurians FD-317 M1]|uniref:Uncharacterized protein n=1 Tax=Collybiopsis luxurians FD-317 M1 TaxID=944289 RepID=A0A0D0CFR8_9AGAR|nr:hypothetical protein GYMLUDRAFT_250126 [Collybiopsis luxurians FD-317 M1]
MPYVCIDAVVPLLQEDYSSRQLCCPNGFVLDCTDASLPHKIIYDSLANKPNRYQKMTVYLDSLINDPAMLMGAQTAQVLKSEHCDPSNSHTPRRKGENVKFTPYLKSKPRVPPISNTFLVPDSIFMPKPLLNWASALRILSEHNQALCPPSGVKPGFQLPPIQNIISPAKAETVQLLFHSWLRIHEMILTQLNNLTLCLLSKQWQGLLEVAGWRFGHPDVATMTDSQHQQDISVQPVSWNGVTLSLDVDLPIWVSQEIVWELQELGFQNDLIELDKQLDTSKMDATQRRSLLNACWEGMASFVDI